MCSSRGMKFLAVLAFAGILALGLTTQVFAFDAAPAAPGSQPSSDVAKKTQAPPPSTKPAPSFGQKLGPQGSQPSGDLSTNAQKGATPPSTKPAPSFGQKLGPQGSQPSGDLSTNKAEGAPPSTKPAPSFGQKLGPQGSQPAGDLSTNKAKPQQ